MTSCASPAIGRILIVGCPRSGTTYLQSLLAAHPELTSFPESHVFSRIRPVTPLLRQSGFAAPKAIRRARAFVAQQGGPGMGSAGRNTAGVARWFAEQLDAIAQRRGVTCWIEKTPVNLHALPHLACWLPDAGCVHLVRSGEDVAASLYDATRQDPAAWGGAWSAAKCARRWRGDIARTRRYAVMPRHAVVRYEDLIQDTAGIVRGLCGFLGVTFHPAMLRGVNPWAAGLARDFETWKAPVAGGGSRKFDTVLNPRQQRRVRRIIAGIAPPPTSLGEHHSG